MSRRFVVALLLGLGVVVATLAAVLIGSDRTTVLEPEEVLKAATTGAGSVAVPAIEDGALVYVYQTVGHEEIDALAGARHNYPTETYLTIRPGGCGQIFRWQAIEERWTTWEVCDPEALAVAAVDSFHRWFGVDDLQQYRCIDPAHFLPPAANVTTWTYVCATGDRTEETSAAVVGVETLEIGGQSVETLHVHLATTLSGDSTGGSSIDRWFSIDELLLVKEVSSTASSSSSVIGTVGYTETYEITLETLQPLTP